MGSIAKMSHLEEGLRLSKQFTLDQIAELDKYIADMKKDIADMKKFLGDDGSVATDEQVDSVLDDIFNDSSDNGSTVVIGNEEHPVATDEQVDSLLDDIFG